MVSDNIFINNIKYLIFIPFLYAETHYRFKYFFSWLKKSEPEIIADIPSRIFKGTKLPILIVIKDTDKYPVEILEVSILSDTGFLLNKEIKQTINSSFEEIIIDFESNNLKVGLNYLNIKIQYNLKGKRKTCYNDNHRGTSHKPLPIYISETPLPRLENCFYGETHYHSNYTSDQVEFGASLNSTARLAKSMNFDFFCATDHSYDLDDEPDNYLINDPGLKKWNQFWQEVEDYNTSNEKFLIIPGEEVTLRNSLGKNIHCLIYNSNNFFPGSGDSGDKWFKTYSELSINDVLNTSDENSLVFAAHPAERPPFLQRFLINRSVWNKEDCLHSRLNGLQFINGGEEETFASGLKLWIQLLLEGRKLIGVAGNDAHGNFARFRQVSFPFFKMREHYWRLFGKWRTGVYSENNSLKLSNILDAMKRGNCFMSNGPALQFEGLAEGIWQPMGGIYSGIKKIRIQSLSTPEFSGLTKVKIILGYFGQKKENVIHEKLYNTDIFQDNFEMEVPVQNRKGYIRVELFTHSGKMALSNPIWFE